MSITPATLRLDLKCGRGAISEGEKCHKGPASRNSRFKTAAKIALGAGIGAAALGGPSFMSGHRTGHLTHGRLANPAMAGGLANAAVPAAVGAVAGGALTAGGLAIGRLRRSKQDIRLKAEAERYAEAQAQKALDTNKKLSEKEFFDLYEKTWDQAYNDYINKSKKGRRSDSAGRRCGKGYIAAGKQCRSGGAYPSRKAIAAGLGVAAAAGLTAGALYANRRRNRVVPVRVSVMPSTQVSNTPRLSPGLTPRSLPGDRTTRRITGRTPYGLLPPSPPRLGRTGRMRANTGAAIRRAERRIGQTAREEARRIAQIGNTMAAAGEATGMAAKTGWRELRLRAEAARRRWEPGYRRPDRPRGPRLLGQSPESEPVRFPFRPRMNAPQRMRIRRTDSLTPATLARFDRKLNCGPGSKQCGNSCIPKDRKCRASWNKPVKAAAAVGGIAAAGLVGTALFHPRSNMRGAARGMVEPVMQGGFAAGNAARGNWGGAAKNMANAAMAAEGFGRNARVVAQGYGGDIRNLYNRGKTAAFKWRHHRGAGRR